MGKGGKNTRDVYDFLYSLDWGVCYGPVDSINEVWVKDKRIFCGIVTQRTDLGVNLPDLFGGDNAEGGVKGVLEVYTGEDDQLSSPALSQRVGKTPSTMPGYRAQAHLFFRGGNVPTDQYLITKTISEDDQITESGFATDPGYGFKWSANNPYLPAAKVHVTDLPARLSESYKFIYPFSHYDEITGEPVAYRNFLGLFIPPAPEAPFVFDVDYLIEDDGPLIIDFGEENITVEGEFGVIIDISATARNTLNDSGDFSGALARITLGVKLFVTLPGGSKVEVPTSKSIIENNIGETSNTVQRETAIVRQFPTTGIEIDPEYRALFRNVFLAKGLKVKIYPILRGIAFPPPDEDPDQGGGEILPEHCDIDGAGLAKMPNANPAHIIYECLVNEEWGKGELPENIDQSSFIIAAKTLYDEFFGLFMVWTRQTEIKAFIQEVLDHIKAMLYLNPSTGQWALKLLRNDYSTLSARELNVNNCYLRNPKRRLWGETINEIVVQWTDPISEKEATVAHHNLANISIQGTVVSETRNYYGIRDAWLAQRVAERDVHEAGAPLFSATAEVNRSMWNVTPGEVLKLSWAPESIENMFVRVMSVDYGQPSDRTITIELIEEIFSIEQTAFGEVQKSELVSDRQLAAPLDNIFVQTVPLPFILRNGVSVSEFDDGFPVVPVAIFGSNTSVRIIDFDVYSDVVKANGTSVFEKITTVPPTRSAVTDFALAETDLSQINEVAVSRLFLGSEEVGKLISFGTSEDEHEIVMLDSFDGNTGQWQILRGMYDTIPHAWPVGTIMWETPTSISRLDPTERLAGENVKYSFLPRTTENRLITNEAQEVFFTPSERPYLPFRPANTQMNASGFDIFINDTGFPTNFVATWSNRNRTLEDTVARNWSEGSVTPEPGQTTTLIIEDNLGNPVNEINDITGSSYTFAESDLMGVEFGAVSFFARRNGDLSIFGSKRRFDFRTAGYGKSYGRSYGKI